MRRFRRFGRRFKRRSTNWVPGLTFGEQLNQAAITLSVNTPAAGINSTTIALTDSEDLQLSGGEDAVVVRVVGRFLLFGANTAVTPLPRFCRWAIFVADDANGIIAVPNLFAFLEMATENIMVAGTVLVPGLDLSAAANDAVSQSERWIDIDTSAKRKLHEDKHVYLTLQFGPSGGATTTVVQASGFLRVLLQKPA